MTSEKIPGAVVPIARKGKVTYFQTFGYQDRAAGTAMKPNSISASLR